MHALRLMDQFWGKVYADWWLFGGCENVSYVSKKNLIKQTEVATCTEESAAN